MRQANHVNECLANGPVGMRRIVAPLNFGRSTFRDYLKGMLNAREKPHFPPVEAASSDGVLYVGGSLAPDWMLEAYRRGIFPMPIRIDGRRLIAWLSPDPRGVLELDALHISRRVARRLKRGEFKFTINRAFCEVVEACAAPRRDDGDCWLTLSMQ